MIWQFWSFHSDLDPICVFLFKDISFSIFCNWFCVVFQFLFFSLFGVLKNVSIFNFVAAVFIYLCGYLFYCEQDISLSFLLE